LNHGRDGKRRGATARRVDGNHDVVLLEHVHAEQWVVDNVGAFARDEGVHVAAREGAVAAVGHQTHRLA
jgi:hypothetical protein